jgi:hypothetical protein
MFKSNYNFFLGVSSFYHGSRGGVSGVAIPGTTHPRAKGQGIVEGGCGKHVKSHVLPCGFLKDTHVNPDLYMRSYPQFQK